MNDIIYIGSAFCLHFLWYKLFNDPLIRSTIHSILCIVFVFISVNPLIGSLLSCSYYISDLRVTRKPLYILHHIFSIYACWICMYSPFRDCNILEKGMMVEGSVPLLNYYMNSYDQPKNIRRKILFMYLITHIYFRNINLMLLYFNYGPLLIEKGANMFHLWIFKGFIYVNIYWTFRTIKKLLTM